MDKRKVIIDAARTVFAREGYNGATINKIAKEANLKSHSLVYWYFKDKKELYKAIIEEISPVLNQLPMFWQHIDDPPEKALPLIARTFLSTLDRPEAVQFFGIVLSEVPRNTEMAINTAENLVLALNFMVSYFDRQIELGRLRPHNTQSSARSFIGSFVVYLLSQEIFPPLRAGLPEKEEYVKNMVGIFIKGLQRE
jgi:AcrR family transcriptional regulator